MLDQEKLAALRYEIQKGLDDVDAGHFRDGDEVMAEIRVRLLNAKELRREFGKASGNEKNEI